MKIQVLGTGCAKCKLLAEQTERAVSELGLDIAPGTVKTQLHRAVHRLRKDLGGVR